MIRQSPAGDEQSVRTHSWYCVHCHEWLRAPKGAGFLHARREVQHLLEPLVVSWGWEPERRNLLNLDSAASRFVLENEWQGTRDPAAYLSIPAAIQFHGQSPPERQRYSAEHDWPYVRAECHTRTFGPSAGELLRETRRIEALTGLPPMCPDWYVQMAAFPLPACGGVALQRRLYDEHRVEVPVLSWGGRQLVRVSVQGYNTAEDVETLAAALGHLLPQVARP